MGQVWDPEQLLADLRGWAADLGFSRLGVADINLTSAEAGLNAWLQAGFHGEMSYMTRHGTARSRPAELVPGTVSVITAAMDYLPADAPADWRERAWQSLDMAENAQISVYARGRDYHRVLRTRLQKLAERLAGAIGPYGFRAFTDSAPVLEVELAQRSGIGWRGKHTLALSRERGSMQFLGEIYVDVALPRTSPVPAHCGECTACIDLCPTRAIVAPYRLDARRCLSYLTIEQDGPIPVEFRRAMGNRIYGCDDCQLACPWNKYAQRSALPDFDVRDGWRSPTLLALWQWDEATFLRRTEGSAIRRIGHARWQRNLAVALGNLLAQRDDEEVRQALAARRHDASPLLREHIDWALAQRPTAIAPAR